MCFYIYCARDLSLKKISWFVASIGWQDEHIRQVNIPRHDKIFLCLARSLQWIQMTRPPNAIAAPLGWRCKCQSWHLLEQQGVKHGIVPTFSSPCMLQYFSIKKSAVRPGILAYLWGDALATHCMPSELRTLDTTIDSTLDTQLSVGSCSISQVDVWMLSVVLIIHS